MNGFYWMSESEAELEFLLSFYAGHTWNLGDRGTLRVGHGARNDAGRTEYLVYLHSSGAQLIGEIVDAAHMPGREGPPSPTP